MEGSRPITDARYVGHLEEVRIDLLASGILRNNLDFYKQHREDALRVIAATKEKTRERRWDEIEE
jgi:hypothetical protein